LTRSEQQFILHKGNNAMWVKKVKKDYADVL